MNLTEINNADRSQLPIPHLTKGRLAPIEEFVIPSSMEQVPPVNRIRAYTCMTCLTDLCWTIYNFFRWLFGLNNVGLHAASLPNANRNLIDAVLDPLLQHPEKVVWIPHPQFVAEDLDQFPHEKVRLIEFYHMRTAVRLAGEQVEEVMRRGGGANEFLKWLNLIEGRQINRSLIDDGQVFIEQGRLQECPGPICMNCVDFVYFALYNAGLVPKEILPGIYRTEIQRCLDRHQERRLFYGFDLSRFEEIDLDNDRLDARPGDLLIGFENERPVHVLFLGERDRQGWKGIGLWNMGTDLPILNHTPLKVLQQEYLSNNHAELVFKWCPLERIPFDNVEAAPF